MRRVLTLQDSPYLNPHSWAVFVRSQSDIYILSQVLYAIYVNLLRLGEEYLCQSSGWIIVDLGNDLAPVGAKPLPESMIFQNCILRNNLQWNTNHNAENYLSRKFTWKCHLEDVSQNVTTDQTEMSEMSRYFLSQLYGYIIACKHRIMAPSVPDINVP